MTPQEPISDREAFEYAYRVFIDALEAMAAEPGRQVALNGNYHTAFELLFDARGGAYLLHAPGSYLSEGQNSAIREFLGRLDQIPELSAASGDADPQTRLEANLGDMLLPFFVPLRKATGDLLVTLAAPTALNAAYFRSLS